MQCMTNRYEEVRPIEKAIAEQIFLHEDKDSICSAMVSVAFYEQDWKWAQEKFIELFFNSDADVSGLAATCLGHLARLHKTIEKQRVLKILRDGANKDNQGRIDDAIDDIEMFQP